MWARYFELLLGGWLIASPFVFGTERLVIEVLCGAAIMVFALLSLAPRFRTAHRASIAVAMILAAASYFTASLPPTAAQQNDLITGLLLLMFAIVPSQASLPPREWREWSVR